MNIPLRNLLSRIGPQKNVVDGGRFSRFDRDAYLYEEGDRSVLISVELQSGKPEVIVDASSIDSWATPDGAVNMTNEDTQRVLENLIQFLNRNRITYRLK